jgi:hypothetical protein
LKQAIQLISSLKGKVEFNIYGPIEDKKYWKECNNLMNELNDNIKIFYNRTVGHEEVIDIFEKNHIFLFPTLGKILVMLFQKHFLVAAR